MICAATIVFSSNHLSFHNQTNHLLFWHRFVFRNRATVFRFDDVLAVGVMFLQCIDDVCVMFHWRCFGDALEMFNDGLATLRLSLILI